MANSSVPYASLNTPVVLLDLDMLEANIKEMQQAANEVGVKLRPHTKFHESVEVGKMQFEAAGSIEVGPIEQAEAMAEAGINDIMTAHPFYGPHKFQTVERILTRYPNVKLSIVVDMIEQAEGISKAGQAAGRKVPVVIKLETGCKRYGVLPGEPALRFAKELRQLPGVKLIGIYGHEAFAVPTEEGKAKMAFEVASKVTETARMLRKEGFEIEHVSVGASPTHFATCRFIKEGKFPEITELHPGARVVGDLRYMRSGGNTRETCALTVLVSVMSTSHLEWAVIDAGFKTFGDVPDIGAGEFQGRPSYGSVQGRPDLWFGRISAETGCLHYMEPKKKLSVGERLQIVPNNGTLVINLHDHLYGVRKGVVEKVIPVTGRNRGN